LGFDHSIKGLKKEISSKLTSIVKTKTLIPKIPIDFDWGDKGSISAKSFV
jgi:hypothetical protein